MSLRYDEERLRTVLLNLVLVRRIGKIILRESLLDIENLSLA